MIQMKKHHEAKLHGVFMYERTFHAPIKENV